VDTETRLPLQTGATMLWRVLGAVVVLDGAWAAICLVLGRSVFTPIYWFYFLPLVAVILMKMLGATRASDCVFDPAELRIEGGKYDGFHIGWSAVEPQGSALLADGTLKLDLGSGVQVPVATARDAEERRSLETLLQAIRERKQPEVAASSPAPTRPHAPGDARVVACAACGAAAVVDDAESVKCHYCGAAVVIPEDVRARVRAARALRRERSTSDALVERLLEQPSAKRVNTILGAAAAVGLLWMPLPIMTGSWPTVFVTAGLVVLVGLAAQVIIVDRRAVHRLTLDFGAHAGARAGEPERCRRCDAPLPRPADDGIVVACAYCEAENVLGVDPRGAEQASRSAETELRVELTRRSVARTRARLVAALAGAAVCVALALVVLR
jgi:hypothetical protein